MKAADALAAYLFAHRVTDCYEMIGGMITHLVDSLTRHGGFSITSVHHEQSAAFAAEGISRQSAGKRIGLALATSGPGATNLITGIGSCWFDSVPCLFLTGQVNVGELKHDRPIRQQGFQELDIVSIVQPITKYATRILRAEDLLPALHSALTAAVSGRQGPALLDISNNVQRENISDEIVSEWVNKPIDMPPLKGIDEAQIGELRRMCAVARKPLFLFGGGAKWSPSIETLVSDLVAFGVPYVSSLMGQERLDWSSSYFGLIGSYGHRTANCAIQQCDLLIVVGSRLDVRQTGADAARFAAKAKIIQVDIDAGQIDNRVKADLSINSSACEFFEQVPFGPGSFPLQDGGWLTALRSHFERTFVDEYAEWEISPYRLFEHVSDTFADRKVEFVCDVGNHQMWAAHCLKLTRGQAIHHSGGMGAMGFALPAAIGIATAATGKTVVLTGDGSLQVNMQELDTLARVASDILIIVFNNRSLGMVKNFQDMYFEGRNRSTKIGYSCPSFAKVAEAFGVESYTVTDEQGFRTTLERIKNSKRPILLEIVMEHATECRPRLLFGNSIDQQHPPMNESIFPLCPEERCAE